MNSNQLHQPSSGSRQQAYMYLNDQGIGHLARHDTQAALACFTRALTIVQQGVATAPVANEGSIQSPVWLSVSIQGLSDDESGLYIHCEALSLQIGTDGSDSVQTHSMAAVAILFNLALTYHVHGVKHQKMARIQKASRLYELCSGEMMSSPHVDPTLCLFVSMACLNNKAQIQYQYLGSKANAAELACQLQQQLEPVLTAVDNEGNLLSHTYSQLDEMFLNAQMLSHAVCMGASAA
ncbi:expressed unknown protein [Seminavis robusta]|uniref:Uncharacterized protein n=1 Tax=Seminavis robusta TaxID=568900 RepID=A0A9N8HIA4_9STRA|nr:expressed unknown protein [Seminavis robusta]|eukprot:Sro582_g170510.1 n/a (237) ;mRNA; r:30070-30780